MAVEIYGGDPAVIATRDELMRIAVNLQHAASLLQQAPLAVPNMFLDFLPNPIPNLQLAISLPPVVGELERLAKSCLIAAEGYFSTEAQIMHFLQGLFRPVSDASGLLAQANPISVAMADITQRTGAALAVVGLIAAPSFGSSQLIAQGARVVAHSAGHQTPAAMLAGVPATGFGGSARLLSQKPVLQSGGLTGVVNTLRTGYWSPASSVRIQAFSEGPGRALVVFIPGTQNFGLTGSNPLNISSNLGVFSGAGAPSQTAVVAALKEAGAGANDRVIFVGHSQGGMIAANLAATKQDYSVSGVITLGSPVSHINLAVPTISIQHQQDPIPLLSGSTNPMTENWVTISSAREFSNLVQAHHIASYAETALVAQESENKGLTNVLNQMRIPQGQAQEQLFEIRSR